MDDLAISAILDREHAEFYWHAGHVYVRVYGIGVENGGYMALPDNAMLSAATLTEWLRS